MRAEKFASEGALTTRERIGLLKWGFCGDIIRRLRDKAGMPQFTR